MIMYKTLTQAKAAAQTFAHAHSSVPSYYHWEEWVLQHPEWARYSGTLLYYCMEATVARFGTAATFANPFWQALGACCGEAITISAAHQADRDRGETL